MIALQTLEAAFLLDLTQCIQKVVLSGQNKIQPARDAVILAFKQLELAQDLRRRLMGLINDQHQRVAIAAAIGQVLPEGCYELGLGAKGTFHAHFQGQKV